MLWGSGWDALLARDDSGMLAQLMEECVDGEYQDFKSKDGAYIRKHFFGRYPETAALVADWSDDEIWTLTRGGHDPEQGLRRLRGCGRITRASRRSSSPRPSRATAWARRAKARMITHQQKKMGEAVLRQFRDRFQIELSDDAAQRDSLHPLPRGQPGDGLPAARAGRRSAALCRPDAASREPLQVPPLSAFEAQLKGTAKAARSRPPWPSCGC